MLITMMRRALTVLMLLGWVLPAQADAPRVSLQVSVQEQKLTVWRDGRRLRTYPVSTSRYGTGSAEGSYKTPLGSHRVARKIGAGASPMTVFKDRVPTGSIAALDLSREGSKVDLITSRILWLEGLEPGKNRGPGIDSFDRFIYIHGTNSEGRIGSPASIGCIRMRNADVIELFDLVPAGTAVTVS